MELVGADALLGASKQVDRLQPLVQRNVAALEDGADRDRELLAAVTALADADARARPFKA